MAPMRGRGAFRGRGAVRGRGRGGRRGRAGRGGRGGNRSDFAAGKLQQAPADGLPVSPEHSESETESDAATDVSSDEEEAQAPSSAFHSLLQTFQSNTPKEKPPRKRRKMAHDSISMEDGSYVENELQEVSNAEASDAGEDEVNAEDGAEDDDDEDDEDRGDSFVIHFADPEENELSMRLKAVSENKWTADKWEITGGTRCVLQTPDGMMEGTSRPKVRSTKDVNLKARLVESAQKVLGQFNELEQNLAPSIFDYQDILFGARTVQNADRLRKITCLHALNHIFKTRDRVIKNNAKLAREQEDNDAEYRDQGFTRPKVLFLLETKQSCVRAVDVITNLCSFEQQENKKRFLDSFSLPEDKFSEGRPADFRELFEGNDENEFRIGLKFTRKTMKLYSKFYNSDIIFASALGLRRAIESGDAKKKDADFLSSIEIVIMDQVDATLMQNWEHAEYVFEHLNQQPKEAHGCDFSRVRSWYLDGHAKHLRQTILLSAYLTPKIVALHNKHMRNVSGRLKMTPDHTTGAIESLTHHSIRQTFSRFDSPSHTTDPDSRFKFFTSTVLPLLSRLPAPVDGGLGVVLFVPSYLDFVRVRNYLVDTSFAFGLLSEYTDETSVRRARSHFASGKHELLLYTGRAHHFHRYNLRGVKRVVFYGVPENAGFYREAVEWIARTVERGGAGRGETGVRVLFSRWERLELERVVGGKRVGRLVGEKGDTFDFV
ncbi:U3 small nucleolar RNA-associated protein 25 [Polyplosphaeria fusca]|uniref:U3 small nucleolar RNA-associated protein 25 n=1 Tax=Polyplosphaeria fusca TaxID=682080 RepID=A0A9P4QLU1_9PLEO|nr:U3 small nucleolar RNA-associated protein 25 [Polyplosphaeria fusca]